jgi:tight adherence protein B
MQQLWILLFISCLTVFLAAALTWWRLSAVAHKRKLEQMLRDVDPGRATVTTTVLHRAPAPGDNRLRSLLGPSAGASGELAGGDSRSRSRLIARVGLALAGLLVGARFQGVLGPAALLIGAAVFAALPQFVLARKSRKRMAAIEKQFPDVLDFLARSVRAGNALSISLEMLASEASEPLRSEFLKVTRELALGASLENALANLVTRVPLIETRFFVAAVLLQRESGGNLAEVLSRLAASVRERLRLTGHVRAISGQARLTAAILTILPIVVVIMLKIISPKYLNSLTADALGRTLLGGAVVAQILGYLCMKKIIHIEV